MGAIFDGNTAALREWERDQERRDTSIIPDDERRDARHEIAKQLALEWIDDAWDSLMRDTRAYTRFKEAMLTPDYTEMGRIIYERYYDTVINSLEFKKRVSQWEGHYMDSRGNERGDYEYDRRRDRE